MIILDTSFIVAYYNNQDSQHKKALFLMDKISENTYGEVTITDYIFDECATVLFSKLKNLKQTIEICDKIKAVVTFKIDEKLFADSWNIFKSQKNTKLSFTDCSIVALMQERGIKHIATFDEDFKKVKGIKIAT